MKHRLGMAVFALAFVLCSVELAASISVGGAAVA